MTDLAEMDPTQRCSICQQVGDRVGDHDPAYHVAKAYHIPTRGRYPVCWSCREAWPCDTFVRYVGTQKPSMAPE